MDQSTNRRYHEPVMVEEVLRLLTQAPQGVVVDATYGGGGHTRHLLAARPDFDVVAFDRDPDVPKPPSGVTLRGQAFSHMDEALDELGIGEIAGVLFDLGVSGHQLDTPQRGFSYREAGPLDMRMGPDAAVSADDIVNTWSEGELGRILREFGEERFAGRIAAAIVTARPITDTAQLAEIVKLAIPAATRRTGGHPARRTFQAIRLAANDELTELQRGLDASLLRLAPLGRCVVIAYHSLEDRIVKRRFADGTRGCECPPEIPVCVCGREPGFRALTRKPLRPSSAEVAANPRARSARLRAVEKVAA